MQRLFGQRAAIGTALLVTCLVAVPARSDSSTVPEPDDLRRHVEQADAFTPYRVLSEMGPTGQEIADTVYQISTDDECAAADQNASCGGNRGAPTFAQISIVYQVGMPEPTFTGPGRDATPSVWDCRHTNHLAIYTVTCTPVTAAPKGDWYCPSPYVLASHLGAATDTSEGFSGCGETIVSCQPQQMPMFAHYCVEHTASAYGDFVCQVNYSGLLMTVDWSVLCRTYSTE